MSIQVHSDFFQVEEMQKSLAVKSAELQAKNNAANAKLKQMVKNQQEAEKQKTHSQEIQKLLEKQKVYRRYFTDHGFFISIPCYLG